MVEKFEAGKFYKSRERDVPFYISEVNGDEVVMEAVPNSWETEPSRYRIKPLEIRTNYFSDFVEVSREEIEKLIQRREAENEFLRQRLDAIRRF